MANTPLSLLEKLCRAEDPELWQRLTALYAPLLGRWVQRYQLQSADTDDVVQEVLLHVAERMSAFQHNGRSGAFRCWLRTILAYRLRKFWTARDRNPVVNGGSNFLEHVQELEDPATGISHIWKLEHDQHVANVLLDMVRPNFTESTWQAFCRTVLDGTTIQEVAQELNMTPNAVCIAKSRVLRELRREGEGLLE